MCKTIVRRLLGSDFPNKLLLGWHKFDGKIYSIITIHWGRRITGKYPFLYGFLAWDTEYAKTHIDLKLGSAYPRDFIPQRPIGTRAMRQVEPPTNATGPPNVATPYYITIYGLTREYERQRQAGLINDGNALNQLKADGNIVELIKNKSMPFELIEAL